MGLRIPVEDFAPLRFALRGVSSSTYASRSLLSISSASPRSSAEVPSSPQRFEPQRILAAALLKGAQCIADCLARVLVLTRFHDLLDESILLVSKTDVPRRHPLRLPLLAKFAKCWCWYVVSKTFSNEDHGPGTSPRNQAQRAKQIAGGAAPRVSAGLSGSIACSSRWNNERPSFESARRTTAANCGGERNLTYRRFVDGSVIEARSHSRERHDQRERRRNVEAMR